MKLSFVIVLFSLSALAQVPPDQALREFQQLARSIKSEPIRRAATQNNGRIKPLDSFARENVLFIQGKHGQFGLDPVQTLLGMMVSPVSSYVEMIEVRDPDLRVRLGFSKKRRYFSVSELQSSPLSEIATPLFDKQERNSRSVSESEKKVMETFHQTMLAQSIISGQALDRAFDFSIINEGHEAESPEILSMLQNFTQALKDNQPAEARSLAKQLVELSRGQPVPDIFEHYLQKLDLEVSYNDWNLLTWSAILYILLACLFLFFSPSSKWPSAVVLGLIAVPLSFHILDLGLRVYITQFAPVTNMYGTMVWVSLGVSIFASMLFQLYRNLAVLTWTLLSSGLILLLAQKIPLILSPDMDPIVAVLRSNLWLSTHVTVITISYAAFTIAMVIGNVALIRLWTHKDNKNFFKEYSHYVYRMIQLGCFLLTVGIILGGVWADYSWGRFWGWDPKETWALIADLGFLVILHARYIGWVDDFAMLAWSPIAYLLVIMAWYGVNFILASGLHSYGFSSGGATMVMVFVTAQLVLSGAGLLRRKTLLGK